ncbi:hypothetical protein GE061_019830 [Apolygus lucorum]|uniref:Uncharacterized protein n=1 Tax=Apolygus lucorum TaxID=248454 RepID=A0A8S9X9I2_APOLU|nr:hypothetical protein GE061_019830 [Apolygus lucorum]
MVARGNSLLVLVVLGLLAVWTVSVRSQRILPSRPIYFNQGFGVQPVGYPQYNRIRLQNIPGFPPFSTPNDMNLLLKFSQ